LRPWQLRLANVDAKSTLVHSRAGDAVADQEIIMEGRLHVPEWDFVSPHALEQEYVEMIASSVSVI